MHHYGVIAASQICSVEKVLCRLTEQIFFIAFRLPGVYDFAGTPFVDEAFFGCGNVRVLDFAITPLVDGASFVCGNVLNQTLVSHIVMRCIYFLMLLKLQGFQG